MKYILLLIVIFTSLCDCWSQTPAAATAAPNKDIAEIINISPSLRSVNSSLPFDRPAILKWTASEPIIIDYAGLIEIKRGSISDYYQNWAQDNSFYELTEDYYANATSAVAVKEIPCRLSVNSDGKYDMLLYVPTLKPNQFYDIKILRRPLDRELELYFDLFQSASQPLVFARKLYNINQIKKPFVHVNFDGYLATDQLLAFYNMHLGALYIGYAAATTDAAKKTIKDNIKSTILLQSSPDRYLQVAQYVRLFSALRAGNNGLAATEIGNLYALQNGFATSPDASHVGNLTLLQLDAFYRTHPEIDNMLDRYAVVDSNEQAYLELIGFLDNNNFPIADYMFRFGETLSATTKSFNFDTRSNFTITPDFGYVFYYLGQDANNIMPYLGVQLEFRYFDKNIPFNLIKPKTLLHYLSFTTGLTLSPMKKEGKRDDFFGSKSLVMGMGIRISSAVRTTLGGIIFRKEDPNPLIDKKRTAVAPYIGISIDLRLKSLLNELYGLIPTKKT